MGIAPTAPKPQRLLAWGAACPAAAWSLGLPFSPGSCGHPHWFITVHRSLNPAVNTPAELPWTGHVLSCVFHLPVRYGALLEHRDEGWQGLLCAACPPPNADPWDAATLRPARREPALHLTLHRLAVESRAWALR